MTLSFFQLAISLVIILIASEIFTNALEHLGERLKISEGVTGSLFAAIGTALPETMVPILALVAGTSAANVNEEIGVGAILGAPLMLSTLSIFLMALAVVRRRGINGSITPEPTGFIRDTRFFLMAFVLAAIALFIPVEMKIARMGVSVLLVLLYVTYIVKTLHASKKLVAEGNGTAADNVMFLSRVGLPTTLFTIILQTLIGLGVLVAGALGFIDGVAAVSEKLGISVLLLSLIIIPIATELPEKVNSILWIRKGKDTLALGNITGAMVFQGTILPAIGILLTPWQPRHEVLIGVFITLSSAFWLWINARNKNLKVWMLFINGAFYFAYIIASISFGG
jgi:cation:H+ antiporter